MSLDAEERALLVEILDAARETKASSERSAAASENALKQLIELNEIVAREVSPLGGFRKDVLRVLEQHFNKGGELELKIGELDQWRREHDEHHRLAANGR